MVWATGMGAVWVPPKKGAVLVFFQLIVAMMKIPLEHGAVIRRRYISVAFDLSAALDLLHPKVILLTGISQRESALGAAQIVHVDQWPLGIA